MPNLPKIPESLIKTHSNILNYPYITSPPDGNVHQRFEFDENLATWIRKNIIDQWQDDASGIFIATSHGEAPHVDRRRFFNLMYIFEPGGDDVRTVFYKARSHNTKFNYYSRYFLNYDDLEIIESHQLKHGSWNFLYASTIHSVENITKLRATVQLGLMFDISDELLLR